MVAWNFCLKPPENEVKRVELSTTLCFEVKIIFDYFSFILWGEICAFTQIEKKSRLSILSTQFSVSNSFRCWRNGLNSWLRRFFQYIKTTFLLRWKSRVCRHIHTPSLRLKQLLNVASNVRLCSKAGEGLSVDHGFRVWRMFTALMPRARLPLQTHKPFHSAWECEREKVWARAENKGDRPALQHKAVIYPAEAGFHH